MSNPPKSDIMLVSTWSGSRSRFEELFLKERATFENGRDYVALVLPKEHHVQ